MVVEECIVDEPWVVVVHEDLNDDANHLPDLVVDKALALDHEPDPLRVDLLAAEIEDIAAGLGILCLEPLGIVVEVVAADELLAAVVYFLEESGLGLLSGVFGEKCKRTQVAVTPRFHHVPDFEARRHPPKAMDHYLRSLKDFLELH